MNDVSLLTDRRVVLLHRDLLGVRVGGAYVEALVDIDTGETKLSCFTGINERQVPVVSRSQVVPILLVVRGVAKPLLDTLVIVQQPSLQVINRGRIRLGSLLSVTHSTTGLVAAHLVVLLEQ